MNCQELRSDIEKLRNKQQKLRELLDNAQDKAMIRSIEEKVDSLGDSILEKYMEGFFEKNPEIEQWKVEPLERLKYVDGYGFEYYSSVNSIAPTPDGGVLVGGSRGEIYEYRKDGDEWKVEPLKNDIFNYVDMLGHNSYSSVTSIAPTLDGGMLVGGKLGKICECRKEGGEWKVKPLEMFGFVDENGFWKCSDIETIVATPDGGMLVGGDYGAICEYRKEGNEWKVMPLERLKNVDKNGIETYGDVVSIAATPDGGMLVGGSSRLINEYRREGDKWRVVPLKGLKYIDKDGKEKYTYVKSIAPTPDGGMLVGGVGGVICEYRKEEGEWKTIPLERFKNYVFSYNLGNISFIVSTSDGGMLVGGDNGVICEYRKEGDKWKAIPLERFKYVDEDGNKISSDIKSIVTTPDGGMMVGGEFGALSEYSKLPHTLATLKEHLAEIVEKGGA